MRTHQIPEGSFPTKTRAGSEVAVLSAVGAGENEFLCLVLEGDYTTMVKREDLDPAPPRKEDVCQASP